MKKNIIILSLFMLLSGCLSLQQNVTQESTVETDFEGSYVYERFRTSRTEGPLIPGLFQDLVPQGMAYIEERKEFVVSNYRKDRRPGALSLVSSETGEMVSYYFLYNNDGSPHTGHLGGVATGEGYLWISSGSGVYYLPLSVFNEAQSGEALYLSPKVETETKGSFATFSVGYLWVGEFTRANGDYPVPPHHWREDGKGRKNRGWLGAYSPEKLLEEADVHFPEIILSIPHEIQGAVVEEDRIYLSASFGRKNKSRLLVFPNPLGSDPHETFNSTSGAAVPLWILTEGEALDRMILPPMSEAVVLYGDTLAILFESAARKYRDTALYPLDKLQFIPLDVLETSL